MKFSLLSMAVVGALSVSASAQITAFDFVDVDNSAGGSALDGFTTTDITIDFDSRWTGSQMLIELTQGSILVDSNFDGTNGPADAFLQTIFPATQFGTYLTLNARAAGDLPDQVEAFGGAVNLGGDSALTFDSGKIDAVWTYFPSLPYPPDFFDAFQDQDDFLISRVTLSDDAEGTFKVLASAGGIISTQDFASLVQTVGDMANGDAAQAIMAAMTDEEQGLQVEGQIAGGAFVVPEPASLGALAMSSALVLLRRR